MLAEREPLAKLRAYTGTLCPSPRLTLLLVADVEARRGRGGHDRRDADGRPDGLLAAGGFACDLPARRAARLETAAGALRSRRRAAPHSKGAT